MEFSDKIKKWVEIDNQMRVYQERMKELRLDRNDIADNILEYIETNNLGDAVIEISDGKLKFNNTKQTSPLTFKFVKQCLNECIGNPANVDKIINYIKEKRVVHYTKDIKRQYSKVT